MYDVIIVGGSYAGMAAALQLARGRRQVAVLDAGQRRNRFAATSHGLLAQDGKAPEAIANEAKAQLLAYPTVTWREESAVSAAKVDDYFTVRTAQDESLTAKRLILATGVVDELPEVPGLAERWGRSVFHCPYCHGYELSGPLGVLATGEISMHQALLIPEWGPTTFFTNGIFEPNEEQLRQLQAHGTRLETELVTEISGEEASVQLASGRVVELAGLFVTSKTRPSSPLAEELGCEFVEGPLGPFVKTDETQETSVAGMFACGDLATMTGSITFAIAAGAMAGVAAHRSLIFGHAV